MSEDSYTIKEMFERLSEDMRAMRSEQQQAIANQAVIVAHNEATNKHLEQLNSKTAKNMEAISFLDKKTDDLEKDHVRFRTVVKTVSFVGGVLWAGVTFLWR